MTQHEMAYNKAIGALQYYGSFSPPEKVWAPMERMLLSCAIEFNDNTPGRRARCHLAAWEPADVVSELFADAYYLDKEI